MTTTDRESFETCWPSLARQLDAILYRRGIDRHTREDLVQETAVRLLQRWDRIDTTRPLVPFAATIALNLMRDRIRRARVEVEGGLEPLPEDLDVERQGLARLELTRVARAMRSLSPSHRQVLLATVAEPPEPEEGWDPDLSPVSAAPLTPSPGAEATPSKAAVKMMRMRARRRLAAVLETTAVAVAGIRVRVWRILNEPAHAAAAVGAGALFVSAVAFPQDGGAAGRGEALGSAVRGSRNVAMRSAAPRDGTVRVHLPVNDALRTGDRAAPAPVAATDPALGGDDDVEPADVGANVVADPFGETVVDVQAGRAAAKVKRTEGSQGYGVCATIRVQDFEEDDCSAEETSS